MESGKCDSCSGFCKAGWSMVFCILAVETRTTLLGSQGLNRFPPKTNSFAHSLLLFAFRVHITYLAWLASTSWGGKRMSSSLAAVQMRERLCDGARFVALHLRFCFTIVTNETSNFTGILKSLPVNGLIIIIAAVMCFATARNFLLRLY